MLENTERKGAQEQSLIYTSFCSLRQRNFRVRAIRIRGQGSGVSVSRQGSGSVRENWNFTDPLELLVSSRSREAAKECSPRRKAVGSRQNDGKPRRGERSVLAQPSEAGG
jgi:hypothetical protein